MAEYVEVRREPIDYEVRGFILRRDNYTCRYCGSKKEPFHLDHVYPVSKGGETSEKNLVTACQRCNSEKHAAVGIWPKPIGYFEKKPVFSMANSLLLSAGLFCVGNGFMTISESFVYGKFSILVGIFVLFTISRITLDEIRVRRYIT